MLTRVEAGFQVDTIYIDFSKAFHRVDVPILLRKLEISGVPESLLLFFQSYLKDSFQIVKVDNEFSNPFLATFGVPQGSDLGPLIYSLCK